MGQPRLYSRIDSVVYEYDMLPDGCRGLAVAVSGAGLEIHDLYLCLSG